MGLAVRSFMDSIGFLKDHPVSLAFMFAISAAYFLLSLFISGIPQPNLYTSTMPAGMTSALASSTGLYPVVFIAVVVVLSLLQAGAFPVIVSGCLKRRKSVLKDALGKSVSSMWRLFVVTAVIIAVNMLPLAPAFILGVSMSSASDAAALLASPAFAASAVLLAIGSIVSLYLTVRLWLAFPIVMLENRRPLDSIRHSWRMSKGRVLSIVGAFVLLSLLTFVMSLAVGVATVIGVDYVGVLFGLVFGALAGALSGVLNTIYYLNLKKR